MANNNGLQSEDLDDDPVVKEIPVYLSRSLEKQLYVFQYPLRSVAVTTRPPKVISARIKPVQQDVEMQVEIPTNSGNYDRSKAEQISLNVDGSDRFGSNNDERFFDGSVMDKITYTSTRALLDPGRYTVGLITEGELHLNPIHGIVHVKPAFQYLDKADKTMKAHYDATRDSGADTAESAEEEEVAEQVMVKFARTETDRSKSLREKSFNALQKKKAEEQWIDVDFYEQKSEESYLEKNKMICQKTDYTVANLTQPKDQYIAGLFGPCPEADLVQKQLMASESMSMARIRSLPHINDRVRNLLINVKVISFGRLCSMLEVTNETQKVELLKAVQQVAELVQGNWVVKSEVLYPSTTEKEKGSVKLCGLTGIHPDIMTRARDYVLQQFTQSRTVNRDAMTKTTRIPTEEMLAILQQVAEKKGKVWEFRLPFDQAFVDKYPDVVRRAELMNKAKQKQTQASLAASNEFKTPKSEPGEAPKKTRRRSRKDSAGSSDSGSDTKKRGPRKK